jgi:hypothetical protein
VSFRHNTLWQNDRAAPHRFAVRPAGPFLPHCLFSYLMSNESSTPPNAIIRMGKVSKESEAVGKTIHNFRLMNTPNADPERTATMNQELVNTEQLDYWTLANKRIDEGIAKTARGKPRTVRDDQVRAVEFILTASPEWFKRDENGHAEDMRGSKWVADNLDFLKNKYGEKNLISFTLHQDEKTPHIHAVIVPLTDRGRLSADALFNTDTLPLLQTEYAQAMAPHGLVRGVEGSRRQHQDMKQIYGRQDKTAAELSSELGNPVATMPAKEVELGKVPPLGYGAEEWRAKEQARINAELIRQVQEANERTEQANKRAQEAIQYAIANAGSKEQAEVLNRQLNISEGLKQGNFDQTQAERAKLDELAMRLASGEAAPKSVLERGQQALDQAFEDIKAGREKIAQQPERIEQANNKGEYTLAAWLGHEELPEMKKAQIELETRFRGFQGGAGRLDKLDEEQAKARNDRDAQAKKEEEKKKADKAEQEAGEKRIKDDARKALREADQKAENERKEAESRENDRQKIEKITGQVLAANPKMYAHLEIDGALKEAGVDVWVVDSKRRLALTGSKNEFTSAEIKPGGRPVAEVLHERYIVHHVPEPEQKGPEQTKSTGKGIGE